MTPDGFEEITVKILLRRHLNGHTLQWLLTQNFTARLPAETVFVPIPSTGERTPTPIPQWQAQSSAWSTTPGATV